MKKLILVFFSLAALYTYSQECSSYYFMRNGKTIETTVYNQKGEPNGKHITKVTDVSNSGGVTSANLTTESFDRKGKSTAQGKATIKCNGGVIMVDMQMNVPEQQQQQFSKSEAKADNIYLEYPASMKVGDQLKDGNMTMEMNNGGLQQSLTIVISDRKINGQETITTPAGSWNCFKIGFTTKMSIKTGPMNMPMTVEGTEWFAPSFGIVKTQNKYGGTEVTAVN